MEQALARCPYCGSEDFTPATHEMPPDCRDGWCQRHGGLRYRDTWAEMVRVGYLVQMDRRPTSALPLLDWHEERPYRTTRLELATRTPIILYYDGPYLTARVAIGPVMRTICTVTRFKLADGGFLALCSCGAPLQLETTRRHLMGHDVRAGDAVRV